MALVRAVILAFGLLTRLPVAELEPPPTPDDWGRAPLAWPLVGLAIGLLLAGLAWLLDGATPALQGVVILVAWTLITGGLHLDGLADTADAWIGGLGDPAKTLAILKDPRSGPAAIWSLVLLLLVKLVAVAEILTHGLASWLILAPVAGRLGMLSLCLGCPYVRAQGMGWSMARHLSRSLGWAVVLGWMVLLVLLGGLAGGMVIVTGGVVWHHLRRRFMARLGGITGDLLGAAGELLEGIALLTLAWLAAWR